MNKIKVFYLVLLCSACASDPIVIKSERDTEPKAVPIDVHTVPDAVPRYEKRTRAGNPGKYKVLGKNYTVLADSKGYFEVGMASWYGTKFHGRKTSNGEVYNMYAMTAAHKTLPIPSYVKVTNLKNKRSVVVRVNDRGPFHDNRIIDLSYTAAVKLGIKKMGTGLVEVMALEPGPKSVAPRHVKIKKPLLSNASVMYLQIGAFSSLANAQQCQNKLLSGSIKESRIQIVDRLYKVQVGPIGSTWQAGEVNKKLDYLGYRDSQLIVE